MAKESLLGCMLCGPRDFHHSFQTMKFIAHEQVSSISLHVGNGSFYWGLFLVGSLTYVDKMRVQIQGLEVMDRHNMSGHGPRRQRNKFRHKGDIQYSSIGIKSDI